MKTTTVDIRGVKMKLLTFNRSLELCARMNYESENLDFIDRLPNNAVFYDLGACEGRFAIYAALKGKTVYAFEPENDNFEALTTNLKNNDLEDKVKIFKVGVGEVEKDAILNIGQPWAGGHQKIVEHGIVREDLDFEFKTKQNIKIIALDNFISEQNLLQPEYLKVDVDGSEIPFLKGANKTISKIKKMIFELHKSDDNFAKIIRTLNANNLKVEQEFQVPNEPNLYNIIFSKETL